MGTIFSSTSTNKDENNAPFKLIKTVESISSSYDRNDNDDDNHHPNISNISNISKKEGNTNVLEKKHFPNEAIILFPNNFLLDLPQMHDDNNITTNDFAIKTTCMYCIKSDDTFDIIARYGSFDNDVNIIEMIYNPSIIIFKLNGEVVSRHERNDLTKNINTIKKIGDDEYYKLLFILMINKYGAVVTHNNQKYVCGYKFGA